MGKAIGWAIIIVVMVGFSEFLKADEEVSTIVKKCTYVAGVASRVQDIRQQEGHTYNTFVGVTSGIYKDDEGYNLLLQVAKQVYDNVPLTASSTEVFDSLYEYCTDSYIPPKAIELDA